MAWNTGAVSDWDPDLNNEINVPSSIHELFLLSKTDDVTRKNHHDQHLEILVTFHLPLQIFQANRDYHSVVSNVMVPAVHARYIRVLPYTWYGRITLRLELLGCLSVVPGRYWSFAFTSSTYSLLVSSELQLIMAKHLTDSRSMDKYSAVLATEILVLHYL